jgi:hypothetical protein
LRVVFALINKKPKAPANRELFNFKGDKDMEGIKNEEEKRITQAWEEAELEKPMTPELAAEHDIAVDGLYGYMDHMGG